MGGFRRRPSPSAGNPPAAVAPPLAPAPAEEAEAALVSREEEEAAAAAGRACWIAIAWRRGDLGEEEAVVAQGRVLGAEVEAGRGGGRRRRRWI